MKKFYLLAVLCCALAFSACDKTDDVQPTVEVIPDTSAPLISLHSPTTNDSIVMVTGIRVNADVVDDVQLETVEVIITGPTGASHLLAITTVFGPYNRSKEHRVNSFSIVPRFSAPGVHKITVKAEDKAGNISQSSVDVILHAPTLSKTGFERPFLMAFYSGNILEALDWYGYNHNDLGIAFNADWLATVLYFMVNLEGSDEITVSEWDRFLRDFDVQQQDWKTWDADEDGKLSFDEFIAGVKHVGFLEDWDTNENGFINDHELAAGIFTRWDHNRDNLLSHEDYLGKFYTYLYSRRS